MMKNTATFQFKPFSRKQTQVLTWWADTSPVKDYDGIIADGSIRSGKTLSMSLSFILWAMNTFNGQNFGMAGKTIGSFRRNVLASLKVMVKARGYAIRDSRADNLIIISRGDIENYFYIFGGKDERSQDLIQGITLAGMLFDEVALMPQSFVNQATARCSVEGAKFWFNCNPENPQHFFYTDWVKQHKEKRLLYLHFTMDDNLSLSEKVKLRYKGMYTGVFYKRFILGLWVVADGLCFEQFANQPDKWIKDEAETQINFISVGVDFGGTNSKTTFVATAIHGNFERIGVIKDYKLDGAKGTIDANRLNSEFIRFIRELQAEYKAPIKFAFCDCAETYLISGIKNAVKAAGLGLAVGDSEKGTIIDRIVCVNTLLNMERIYILRSCGQVINALRSAMWDAKAAEKGIDKRKDDFTTDIDTMDAMEYSISRFISRLTPLK
jgi:PBSX family phage terminase large subunit